MRFGHTFQRCAGGHCGSISALGGDTVPGAAPIPTDASADNIFVARLLTPRWAIATQFLYVTLTKDADSTFPIPCDFYVWDDMQQFWFKMNAIPLQVRQNQITAVELMTLNVPPMYPDFVPPGEPVYDSVQIYCRPYAPTGVTDGIYTFGLAVGLAGGAGYLDPSEPAPLMFPVTPDDTSDLPHGACKVFWVDADAKVSFIAPDNADTEISTLNVKHGFVAMKARRIMQTNTDNVVIYAAYGTGS